jgi:hypothetical protein
MKNVLNLICILIFFLLSNCAGYVPEQIFQKRQDMDNIVSSKGIPLSITEQFVGGARPLTYINLQYADGYYSFQTDPSKSYTVLLSSNTGSFGGGQQMPIPIWFKAKYPNLDWKNIPVK